MTFVPPMLAAPFPTDFDQVFEGHHWTAEEKFDGHRIVIRIDGRPADLFSTRTIYAWSRDGKARVLPRHITDELSHLPPAVYDGELYVPGGQSSHVTELTRQRDLRFVVFDLPTFDGPQFMRRRALMDTFDQMPTFDAVSLAPSRPVASRADVDTLARRVWDRGGEGLIVKRSDTPYRPGKRVKTWIKIKEKKTAVLIVTGFVEGRGSIVDRGPYAIVRLIDPDGKKAAVKTLDDRELARFADVGRGCAPDAHPWIGRALRIEYQSKTPDGNYRHPRWDRWEDE